MEYKTGKGMIFKILFNYLIFVICVAGFNGGAVLALILPLLQISLSWLNYCSSKRWQTVLMLQVHLLISTVMGLCLEGYLYLKYISNDGESIIIFHVFNKIGAVLVLTLGIITTLLKYVTTRRRKQKDLNSVD